MSGTMPSAGESREFLTSAEIQGLPITHDLCIDRVPEGFEGLGFAEQWMGVTLPVREGGLAGVGPDDSIVDAEGHNCVGVSVYVEDAVVALIDQGKQGFADFWGSHAAPDEVLTFFEPIGLLTPRENY